MVPSPEQLLAVVQDYYRPDRKYDHEPEESPEHRRLSARWEQALQGSDRWWGFLEDLRRELPGFTIGDATATSDGCFRCAAYATGDRPLSMVRFVIVGCVSILAPVYTIYGLACEYTGTTRNARLVREPLPAEMRPAASIIAKRIEVIFGATALSRSIADTPIPLYVHWQEPPHTTLFHALFTSEPESLP